MAIKSMTGFGAGCASSKGVRVSVELTSVNRKQLDISFRLPSQFASFEPTLQKVVQQDFSRGRVTGLVSLEVSSGAAAVRVDHQRAAAVVEKLRATAKTLKLEDDLSASMLLRVPGLLDFQCSEKLPDESFQALEKALKAALKKISVMRAKEGRELADDLKARLAALETLLDEIKERAPLALSRRRKKIFQTLETAGLNGFEKDERVLKEIALFAEKIDIAEEITRQTSHLKQFRARLRSAEPVGRELDFLVQEMLREINTIGSKANDLEITQRVVAFKTELERIREQVQNVE